MISQSLTSEMKGNPMHDASERDRLETELEEFNERIEDGIHDFHYRMAKKVWPAGTVLQCWNPHCTRPPREVTIAQIAKFLGSRWPECCGRTMHVGDLEEVRG
jgi:hypothetical protein